MTPLRAISIAKVFRALFHYSPIMTTSAEISRNSITTVEDWKRSDAYHNSFLIPQNDSLEKALKNSEANRLPEIAVSAAQGKLLKLIAQSIGAKKIIEVGTLGGYSTIWLAQALPEDGSVTTFEISEKHAEIARQNIANAGFASKVEVVVGPAIDGLKKLQPVPEPYDFAFIDADKESNLNYFIEAKRLLRKNGVIIVDNVVRNTLTAVPSHTDAGSEGVRTLLKALQNDKEIDATTIATVGDKGCDGFIYARKL